MTTQSRSEVRGWCRRAPYLAAWAQNRGLTRGLAHLSPSRRAGTSEMVDGPPSDDALVAHFQTKSPRGLILVDPRIASLNRPTSADSEALWFVLDLAASDPQNAVAPGQRFQAAITWTERLSAIGIDARLEDINRNGGFRIWAFLAESAPCEAVKNLVTRLTADHESLGVPMPRLDPDPSSPGWVRLPGFDPASGCWPQIRKSHGTWLKGEDAALCLMSAVPAEASRLDWNIPQESVESAGIEQTMTSDGRQWVTAYEREAADAIMAQVDAVLPPPSANESHDIESENPTHHIADLAALAESISRSRSSAA